MGMGPLLELLDATAPGGSCSSGDSSRVIVRGESRPIERWLLGLASPPVGTLFVRQVDVALHTPKRATCAVGGGYLPPLTAVTLGDWVDRAARSAERTDVDAAERSGLLDQLGLAFLARTALAHLPPEVRARASLAAALASSRPVLVADATTGFAMVGRDPHEAVAWDRWCAGRDAVLLLPRAVPVEAFLSRGWVVFGENRLGTGESTPGWCVQTSAHAEDAHAILVRSGISSLIVGEALYVRRIEGGELKSVAHALGAASVRLRGAIVAAVPGDPYRPMTERDAGRAPVPNGPLDAPPDP